MTMHPNAEWEAGETSDTSSGLTCIHCERGLCEACQDAFDEDEEAFREYGDTPEGIANWEKFKAEMDAEAAADRQREQERAKERDYGPVDETEIPF